MKVQIIAIAAALFAAALVCGQPTARADNSTIAVSIAPQIGSPVQIGDCAVRAQNTVTWNAGTQVNATAALVELSFTNATDKTVSAVKFTFVFADAFGDPIYSAYGENSGTYSPGVMIKPRLGGVMEVLQPGSPGAFSVTFAGTGVAQLTCGVSAVRFSDGTTWRPDTVTQTPPI